MQSIDHSVKSFFTKVCCIVCDMFGSSLKLTLRFVTVIGASKFLYHFKHWSVLPQQTTTYLRECLPLTWDEKQVMHKRKNIGLKTGDNQGLFPVLRFLKYRKDARNLCFKVICFVRALEQSKKFKRRNFALNYVKWFISYKCNMKHTRFRFPLFIFYTMMSIPLVITMLLSPLLHN